ncbi:hypothetical protein ISN45_Aa01g038080 [Arabidopsis thaliana x Arabidopsis arenosa]|uniref:Transmembrane protein n=1 Tax=Arabidopsis thaliana x Arabidopsis arenosa TaxID=1240361 RepID=A0A8T2CJ03_9BRAS|nr:hypothetical protein ISN45_Aa01g038080 [Arabidopsis thaliana x Arabidopsis arenosa]
MATSKGFAVCFALTLLITLLLFVGLNSTADPSKCRNFDPIGGIPQDCS